MPTDTNAPQSFAARNFALRALAWSLGLFGLLRLSSVETLALLPLTRLQGRIAAGALGAPTLPIDVTLACSGADAIALCAGFILAYPAPWRRRFAGATVGVAMILALNTLRIGTLGHVTSPAWFEALHVYAWPALLILAIAAYVFGWTARVDRPVSRARATTALRAAADPAVLPLRIPRAFALGSVALLALFTAAAPLYLQSAGVLVVAELMARSAAALLGGLGLEASASANVLYTARGGFLVTQECISTPLIPIYIAGVFAYASKWRVRGALMLSAVPLFFALGVTRLLVVALPRALVDSPLVLVHAFYQFLLAAVIVGLAAVWRHGAGPTAARRATAGAAVGAVGVAVLWRLSTPVMAAAFPAVVPAADPQGAMALLPAFQVALYVALCVGVFVAPQWRLCAAGLSVLCCLQAGSILLLGALQRYADVAPNVRELRAWALGLPLLLVIGMVRYERPRR